MTQIASSPKSHQLSGSGHGTSRPFPRVDPLALTWPGFGEITPEEPLAAATPPSPKDEDLLSEVWRNSSYAESVQWELDAAQENLRRAVRQAAGSGVGREELCRAANMTAEELAAALEDFPPAFPEAV